MEKAKETVHIVPIGFQSDKLIASIRQYPVHRIIIITVEGDAKNEKVQKNSNDVKEAFKGIEIEERIVAREEIFQATLGILDIIKSQVEKGREVKINISGGLRNIGISSYIASLVSKVSIYTDIPESGNNESYMLKGVLEIPTFPIKEISQEQLCILHKLEGGVDSLDTLISRLRPDLKKDDPKYNNERSRLSHHIKKLKDSNFVETEKKEKNLMVNRSVLGEIYLKGVGIANFLKREK
jgi:CRISPR-associated protein Csa3